jgi:hypothetical protein
MKGTMLFEEFQGYQQKRLRLFMRVCIGIAAFLLIMRLFVSDDPNIRQAIFVLTGLSAIALFIRSIRLHTVITTAGIYVRYFPFSARYTFVGWENIKQCSLRQYNPLAEYGGWGIKMIAPENGWSYSFSGTTGLQIEFRDGTKLLIGTKSANEIKAILQDAGQPIIC